MYLLPLCTGDPNARVSCLLPRLFSNALNTQNEKIEEKIACDKTGPCLTTGMAVFSDMAAIPPIAMFFVVFIVRRRSKMSNKRKKIHSSFFELLNRSSNFCLLCTYRWRHDFLLIWRTESNDILALVFSNLLMILTWIVPSVICPIKTFANPSYSKITNSLRMLCQVN